MPRAENRFPVQTPRNEQRVDFAQEIKPLLERSCVACHSGEQPRGLFRVDGRDALLKGGASGDAAVVPGHSEKSPLIDYVSGNVPDTEMPPKAQRKRFPGLTTDDVAFLRAWIDQGAEWPKDVVLSTPRALKFTLRGADEKNNLRRTESRPFAVVMSLLSPYYSPLGETQKP